VTDRCSIAVFSLAAGVLAGCATSSSTPPPSAAVEARHRPGQFVWQDLITDDVASCRSFYGALLGWEFADSTRRGKPYVLVLAAGEHIAGIVDVDRDEPDQPIAQWVSYVSVADVDAAVERARQGGGKVLVAPLEVDDAGRAAAIVDPQGAPLGLVRLANQDPVDPLQPQTGRFFWREYLAQDADAALAFYRDVLGFESEVVERRQELVYHVLRRGRSRAGLFEVHTPGVDPNWLPYLRVEDPAALAARVPALGGKVLLAPRSDVRGGSVAIVADPTGAALALQKWPFENGEKKS